MLEVLVSTFLIWEINFKFPSFFAPSPPVPRLRNPGRAACGAACSAAGGLLAASEPHPATGNGGTIFFGSTNPQKPRGGGVCGDLSMKNADSTTQKLDFTMKHGDFTTKRGD